MIAPRQPAADPPLSGSVLPERRYLTVLFCDMVASTEYAERLDPEDFRLLMETFLRRCGAVPERYRGYVTAFQGDAFQALFGYPRANEDDAESAVLAALEIVAAVAEIRDHPVRVRLGLATGEVIVWHGQRNELVATGFIPHLSARLQALAEPNMILADTATFEAARGAIEFTDFGQHVLKGVSEPVRVWQARRTRDLTSRFARRRRLTKLCDRVSEFRTLLDQWEDVVSCRRGRVVLVSGEPGIGKSRLLIEIRNQIRDSPAMALQCVEAFETSTLYPFLIEFARWARIESADAAEEKRSKLQVALARVCNDAIEDALTIFSDLLSIPAAERAALSAITSERQHAIAKQVFAEWLKVLAGDGTLLVLFEDEHWADTASRELLVALREEIERIPALVLVSTRNKLDRSFAEGMLHLKLSALEPSDAEEMMRHISAVTPSRDVVSFVLERAEGIPLFIEELTPREGSPKADSIPGSLQSSLLARLDRLGRAKEIAQLAATIGREFTFDLLLDVSGLADWDLQSELNTLVHSDLIIPHESAERPRFVFKHALLQQAAQSTMLRDRRQHLHGLIATHMERDANASAAHPELLAQHFADAGLLDRAAEYWLRAGLKAARTWAKTDAARMFGKGLEAVRTLPPSRERTSSMQRLALELGDVLYAAIGYATSEGTQAYRLALALNEELQDPEASIRAFDGLFGTHFNSGKFAEAIDASDRLIEVGKNDKILKALVLGLQFKGMSLFCTGELKEARTYLEQALAYRADAEAVGSDFPSIAMIYLSWTLHLLGHPREALARFRDAESIVRKKGAYPLSQWLGDGCILFALRDDRESVTRLTQELVPLAHKNGFNFWGKMARFFSDWAITDPAGGGAGAMQETIRGLGGQEVDKTCYISLWAESLLRSGQLKEAGLAVESGLAQAQRVGEHYYTAELLRLRGEVESRLDGKASQAEASYRAAIAFARRQHAKGWELKAGSSLARLLRSQGRGEEARRELQSIAPDAEHREQQTHAGPS